MSLTSSYPEGQAPWGPYLTLPVNRFMAVMQKMTDLFWLLSPTGKMLESCHSWLSFTGQQEHEASGKGWLDAVYAADRPELEALFTHPLAADQWLESDCHIRRNDGIYRLLHLHLFPVSTSAGLVHEVVLSGVDRTVERLSDAQIRLAIQSSGIGLWLYDLALQQLVTTDQWRRLFGLASDAPLSFQNFLGLVHPEDRARIEEQIARAQAEHDISAAQFRIRRLDGSPRWLMSHTQYLADPSNQSGHLLGSTVDITELKAEQERITEMLESITDGFVHLDSEWRIIAANDRISLLTGFNWRDFLGHSLWEAQPQWRGTAFEERLHTAMEQRQPLSFEWYAPERAIWAHVHLSPTKQGGLWVYVEDITALKREQAALQEKERQFRRLFDANLISIVVHDLEGRIYEVNDAFLSLTGYNRAEFFEQHLMWSEMTPPEHRAAGKHALQELARTGTAHSYEIVLRHKDDTLVPVLVGGTIYRRETASPLCLAWIVDLTAQKALDQQKDLMLSLTSHELKTPLSALKGTLQLLQRRTRRVVGTQEHSSPALRAFFDGLSKSVQDALRQVEVQTHLIDELLDASRITAGTVNLEREPCDLVPLVRETVEDLRLTTSEHTLELEVSEAREIHVLADLGRIREVVTNYLTNAIRYSPAGQPILVGLRSEEGNARVWVRDQGPGLTAEQQQRIWQRHQQIESIPVQSGSGKGLGLGLYICQTLIRQQGGEVGVESEPGKGSIFWFTLPIMT